MAGENVEQELRVRKIKNGTVIDHLPAGSALTVLHLLGIGKENKTTVSALMNVQSKSSGMKDVVKVEDRFLRKDETDKLALIAPGATVNIVKNYDVAQKNKVTIPNEIIGMLKCGSSSCITNQQEPITPLFTVEMQNPIRLRCKFCDRILEKDLIESQL